MSRGHPNSHPNSLARDKLHLMGMHLTGVHFMGVHLTGVYLMGVLLMDVYVKFDFQIQKGFWAKLVILHRTYASSARGESNLRLEPNVILGYDNRWDAPLGIGTISCIGRFIS
jgi:hypothetical protein